MIQSKDLPQGLVCFRLNRLNAEEQLTAEAFSRDWFGKVLTSWRHPDESFVLRKLSEWFNRYACARKGFCFVSVICFLLKSLLKMEITAWNFICRECFQDIWNVAWWRRLWSFYHVLEQPRNARNETSIRSTAMNLKWLNFRQNSTQLFMKVYFKHPRTPLRLRFNVKQVLKAVICLTQPMDDVLPEK